MGNTGVADDAEQRPIPCVSRIDFQAYFLAFITRLTCQSNGMHEDSEGDKMGPGEDCTQQNDMWWAVHTACQ